MTEEKAIVKSFNEIRTEAHKEQDLCKQIKYLLINRTGYFEQIGREFSSSFRQLKASADYGNIDAKYYLSGCYEYGLYFKQNKHTAFKLCEEASLKGHAGATNRLGTYYDEGIGCDVDEAKAVNCYRKAANQGNFNGQINICHSFWDKIGKISGNEADYNLKQAFTTDSKTVIAEMNLRKKLRK